MKRRELLSLPIAALAPTALPEVAPALGAGLKDIEKALLGESVAYYHPKYPLSYIRITVVREE